MNAKEAREVTDNTLALDIDIGELVAYIDARIKDTAQKGGSSVCLEESNSFKRFTRTECHALLAHYKAKGFMVNWVDAGYELRGDLDGLFITW